MELKGKKILFLGDSITQGCSASSNEKGFVSLIARNEGANCVNYGIGGTEIAHQVLVDFPLRHNNNFVDRADKMEAEADAVIVFGGTNDYGHGDAPIGNFSDRDPKTFYGAIHTLILKLINKYPMAHIAFITPLHRINECDPANGRSEPSRFDIAPLSEYVKVIREVTEYYSIPLLDLYASSGMHPEIPIIKEKFMPDGLHPNDAGHKRLADKITSFLKSL